MSSRGDNIWEYQITHESDGMIIRIERYLIERSAIPVVDIIPPEELARERALPAPAKRKALSYLHLPRFLARILYFLFFRKRLAGIAVVTLLMTMAGFPLFSAFEAHVINVTAQIEPLPSQCDALSKGYWANHEGCHSGNGESDWTSAVNSLSSSEFSSAFATTTGNDICAALWMPNCGWAGDLDGMRCRASAHALADELNVVSKHLNLDAFIAGADDTDPAFINLGISSFSTVREALAIIEAIIVNLSATHSQLRDASHIAARIYEFYEFENPFAPRCIFDPDDIPQCLNGGAKFIGNINVENNNDADVNNDEDVDADSGGNSASGGGIIETGNATSTATTTTTININKTIIDVGCCFGTTTGTTTDSGGEGTLLEFLGGLGSTTAAATALLGLDASSTLPLDIPDVDDIMATSTLPDPFEIFESEQATSSDPVPDAEEVVAEGEGDDIVEDPVPTEETPPAPDPEPEVEVDPEVEEEIVPDPIPDEEVVDEPIVEEDVIE